MSLLHRYVASDLSVFDVEERRRFLASGDPDPRTNAALAWELLYRLEPGLYDRLVRAEPLHPGILEWLPGAVGRALEVGAGSGRLTVQLAPRCGELIAVEPAGPLRRILQARLRETGHASRVTVVGGFFDGLPAPDEWADLVIACSSFTPEEGHGADAGLREMERCCMPGGRVVIVWPNHLEWLARRGYRYLSFPGEMAMEFSSLEEAIEVAEVFYPDAVGPIRRKGSARVPYPVIGHDPPRDLAYKVKPGPPPARQGPGATSRPLSR